MSSEKISRPNWKGTKIPELAKSKDVTTKYKNIECLKEHLKDRNEWNDSSNNYQSINPNFSFIGQNNDELKSCLVVEYYKQTEENKWWGEFKLVWSLSANENSEGLITVFNAKTEDGKLKTDSSIYIVKKGGNSQDKILANYKLESVEKEISDDSSLSEYFPKSNTSTKGSDSDDYWGFNPNIGNICKSTECPGITGNASGTTTSKQWTWNNNSSGGVSITEFSSNFDTWWLNKSTNNQQWNQIKEDLKKLKGTWSKQG